MATASAPEAPIVAGRGAMRAREPDASGFVVRDGMRIGWERCGAGTPAVLLLPTWSVIHARHWKLQVPDLARRTTVVTFDGRGNGRSNRPQDAAAYPSTGPGTARTYATRSR